MPRRHKSEALDPRVDDTLLRHVRLVKPHLAPRGSKFDKWITIATAVNRDLGRKVWHSGSGAQGRYGHLVQQYRTAKRDMPEKHRQRMKEYLTLLKERGAPAPPCDDAQSEQSEQSDQGDDDEASHQATEEGEAAEDDDEDEEIEEVEFQREDATMDLTAPNGRGGNGRRAMLVRPHGGAAAVGVAAPGTAPVTSVALFHDTVTALRDMTGGLLHVIEQDHVARREEAQRNREDRKELLEVVRLALQPRE